MTNTINQRIKVTKEDYLIINPEDKKLPENLINSYIESMESRINYDLEFAYDIATNEPIIYYGNSAYIKTQGGRMRMDIKRFHEDSVSVDEKEFEQKFPGLTNEFIQQSLEKREKEAIKRKEEKQLQYIQQYKQLQEARKQLQDM